MPPQFDIEATLDDDDGGLEVGTTRAVERVLQELMAFYRALRELPESYINEVERAQLGLLEHTVFPWLFATMGASPSYFTLPPLEDPLVSA